MASCFNDESEFEIRFINAFHAGEIACECSGRTVHFRVGIWDWERLGLGGERPRPMDDRSRDGRQKEEDVER